MTFGEPGNAINRAAAWLEDSRCQSEPLAYLAPSDLRHIILVVAVVKLGCNVSVGSPDIQAFADTLFLGVAVAFTSKQRREQSTSP